MVPIAKDFLTVCLVLIPVLTVVALFNPVTWYSVGALAAGAAVAKVVTRWK